MTFFPRLNHLLSGTILFLFLVFPFFSKANLSITASNDTSVCAGQGGVQLGVSVAGGTPPYFYSWTCNSTVCALDSVNDDDPQANPATSTWYYIQVIDVNGCASNTDSIWLEVNPLPMVMGGPDVSICGDSAPCAILNPVVTNSTGPFAFQWFPGTGLSDSTIFNPCARPAATTDYYLQATSLVTGCTNGPVGTDSNAWVTVVVHPVPIADAGPDIFICLGDTAQLNGIAFGAGPNYFFNWSPAVGLSASNIPNPTAAPAATTNYLLTAFSNNCPSYADTVRIQVNPLPASIPSINQVMDTLYSSPTNPGDGYLWCLNGQAISGSNQPFWVPTVSGSYAVKFTTAAWGCPSAPSSTLLGQARPSPNHVELYPQPFEEELIVEFYLEYPQEVQVGLFDGLGRMVWQQRPNFYPTGTHVLRLQTGAGLAKGVHVFQLKAGGELLHSQRLIKH